MIRFTEWFGLQIGWVSRLVTLGWFGIELQCMGNDSRNERNVVAASLLVVYIVLSFTASASVLYTNHHHTTTLPMAQLPQCSDSFIIGGSLWALAKKRKCRGGFSLSVCLD